MDKDDVLRELEMFEYQLKVILAHIKDRKKIVESWYASDTTSLGFQNLLRDFRGKLFDLFLQSKGIA